VWHGGAVFDARAQLEAVIRHAADLEDDYDDIAPTIEALEASGDITLVGRLREALDTFLAEENFYGRDLIAGVLAGVAGPAALADLLRASARDLGDDQDGLQTHITEILHADRAGGRAVVGEFVAAGEPTLRRVGLWALGFVVEAADVDVLAAAMTDPDPQVRSIAVGTVPDPAGDRRAFDLLLTAIRDVDEQVRSSAASRLGFCGRVDAVAPLTGLVGDPAPRVRSMVAFALGRLGHESAAPALLRLVEDSDPHVRDNAVHALGRVGGSSAVDVLLAMAHDPDPQRRIQAAKALAPASSDARVAAVLHALAGDGTPEVRAATISGLASTMEPSPLGESLLVDLIGDADPTVRQRVVVLARHLAPDRVGSILAGFVDDPDPGVRRLAENERNRRQT
jgi:HEAT repeat protein